MAANSVASERRAADLESETVAALHAINASFVRALGSSDSGWFLEYLREDFVCVLPTGQRIDKCEFVRRTRELSRTGQMACDEIDVQPLGDVVIVRGVIQDLDTGACALMRYTAVWQAKRACARWQAVAAQFTPLAERRTRRRR